MDIQIAETPTKNRAKYSTPPKQNCSAQDNVFSTPPKNTLKTPLANSMLMQTPMKDNSDHQAAQKDDCMSTPNRPLKENPESKFHMRSYQKSTPRGQEREEYEVSMFSLSRLEQDYSLIHMLGSGNFSKVGLYRSRLSSDLFAIKETRANTMSINEVQALGSLWVLAEQCANVVRYYHSWVQEGSLFLVMQYCDDNLQKIISRHRQNGLRFNEAVIKRYLKEALLGLECLHRLGIVHLDVKPENLLVNQGVLKIADFGMCRAVRVKLGEVEEGDSRYLAREVLNWNGSIDLSRADVFSLAMTVYEMMTLQELPNNGDRWRRIREEGLKLTNRRDLAGYSQELLWLVERMGESYWERRPAAAELLQDRYFKDSVRLQYIIKGNPSSSKRQKSL